MFALTLDGVQMMSISSNIQHLGLTVLIIMIQVVFYLMMFRFFSDPRRSQVRSCIYIWLHYICLNHLARRIFLVLDLFRTKALSLRHQCVKTWISNAKPPSASFFAKYKHSVPREGVSHIDYLTIGLLDTVCAQEQVCGRNDCCALGGSLTTTTLVDQNLKEDIVSFPP